MLSSIELNGVQIGPGQPPYVVAELSANHNGQLDRALRIMEEAKKAGAHAIKLQAYTADSLTVPSDHSDFTLSSGSWAGWNLYRLYDTAKTPYEWFPALFARGRDLGITVFGTPFAPEAVDLLEELGNPAYKIASNELCDWPLVQRAVETRKPVILSTGTATLEEIEATVEFIRRRGGQSIALLHCISAYPAPLEGASLRTIPDLARRFQVPVGLSDHTLGSIAAVTATALGASIVEKHLTLSRADGGPDAAFSAEPQELTELCRACGEAYSALGQPCYGYRSAESRSPIYKRHFYSTRSISAGELLTRENVRPLRARAGIPAREFERVYGRKAACDLDPHQPLTWEHLATDGEG